MGFFESVKRTAVANYQLSVPQHKALLPNPEYVKKLARACVEIDMLWERGAQSEHNFIINHYNSKESVDPESYHKWMEDHQLLDRLLDLPREILRITTPKNEITLENLTIRAGVKTTTETYYTGRIVHADQISTRNVSYLTLNITCHNTGTSFYWWEKRSSNFLPDIFLSKLCRIILSLSLANEKYGTLNKFHDLTGREADVVHDEMLKAISTGQPSALLDIPEPKTFLTRNSEEGGSKYKDVKFEGFESYLEVFNLAYGVNSPKAIDFQRRVDSRAKCRELKKVYMAFEADVSDWSQYCRSGGIDSISKEMNSHLQKHYAEEWKEAVAKAHGLDYGRLELSRQWNYQDIENVDKIISSLYKWVEFRKKNLKLNPYFTPSVIAKLSRLSSVTDLDKAISEIPSIKDFRTNWRELVQRLDQLLELSRVVEAKSPGLSKEDRAKIKEGLELVREYKFFILNQAEVFTQIYGQVYDSGQIASKLEAHLKYVKYESEYRERLKKQEEHLNKILSDPRRAAWIDKARRKGLVGEFLLSKQEILGISKGWDCVKSPEFMEWANEGIRNGWCELLEETYDCG